MMYLFVLFNEFLRRLGYFTSRYDQFCKTLQSCNLAILQEYVSLKEKTINYNIIYILYYN